MTCEGRVAGIAVDGRKTGSSVVAIVKESVHSERFASFGDGGRCS